MPALSQTAPTGSALSQDQITDVVAQACPLKEYRQKKVLLIVPDGTRTAPVGQLFKNRLGPEFGLGFGCEGIEIHQMKPLVGSKILQTTLVFEKLKKPVNRNGFIPGCFVQGVQVSGFQ